MYTISVHGHQFIIQLESCWVLIVIGNMIHFLKCFENRKNYMKNFPFGFVKDQSTHLSFGSFAKMLTVLNERVVQKINVSTNK